MSSERQEESSSELSTTVYSMYGCVEGGIIQL